MATSPKLTGELFSIDEDGKRQDAHIHDPILSEGDAPLATDVAREAGLSEEEIELLYGKKK